MNRSLTIAAVVCFVWGCAGTGAEFDLDAPTEAMVTSEEAAVDAAETTDVILPPCKIFPAICDDENNCTLDTCTLNAGTTSGCKHVPNADGTVCSEAGGSGVCLDQQCCHGTVKDGVCFTCDDGNECSFDASTSAGCVHTATPGLDCDGFGPGYTGTCSTFGKCCWRCTSDGSEGGACPYVQVDGTVTAGTCSFGTCCVGTSCQIERCVGKDL